MFSNPIPTRPANTEEEAFDIIRQLSTVERIAIGGQLNELYREHLRCQVVAAHPEWDQKQVATEVVRRYLAEGDQFELHYTDLLLTPSNPA